ncbi:hypothetical protein niasHT_034609 [Heterodera trifolii]|uniref:Uncharacterized protein n=1 Tax=Heterodera trifolii TaxID=157864 RepID=A0ABD2IRF2_9BILA
MSSLPDSTCEEYRQHIKFWRSEVKHSLGESISNVQLVKGADGTMAVVALATAMDDSVQMVMQAKLPANFLDEDFKQNETKRRTLLELQPLFHKTETEHSTDASPRKIPSELAFHYERIRGQIVDVDDFKFHEKSGAVLFTTAKEISIFKDGEIKNIAQWRPSSAVLNVSFCESDPNFVAFTSSGQLFIDRDNYQVFQSDASLPNVTNGVASLAIQHGFERYEGYFWSPTRPEMVYERVDESPVHELSYTLLDIASEGKEKAMRYPLTGTNNAIVSLRCCRLDTQNGQQFVDLALDVDLRSVVPWLEYIFDLAWTADGNDVVASVMDRVQTQMAVLLIPRGLFVASTELGKDKGIGTIRTIYRENSEVWVNYNKHLHFLPSINGQQNQNANDCSFIIGSERNDLCHLYLHDTRNVDSGPIAITLSSDWAVLKGAFSKVDLERTLVFYLANPISPTLLSLCVSNYLCPDLDCRVLTPSDMSYRFEHASASLNLNPDIGFVCWLSSVQTLPECRLYRFVHSLASIDPLPRAVFTYRIGVQVLSPGIHSFDTVPFSNVGCNVLTPSDMDYRFDRASALLNLKPHSSFVCLLNSAQTLPKYRLNRFVHSPDSVDSLPQRAVFTNGIGAQMRSPSSHLFRPSSDIVKPIFFEYTSANSGKTHHGLLLLPANRNGTAKFPVIHAVYAGPSVQLVRNSWYSVCHNLKYVAFGYAVLMVDGRGSANRGLQFESAIKHRMGSAEIEDQQEGMRMAGERFSDQLDMERVAVIGWSYGGYASLLLLARFPGTYRCACVGEAISDWRLYYTAYTERYMGMSDKNDADAYNKSALSSFISNLPNKKGRLMIVYGMIDETVHSSHYEKLTSALDEAEKPYEHLLIHNESHHIHNGESTEPFHANILSFFARAFSSPSTALQQEKAP